MGIQHDRHVTYSTLILLYSVRVEWDAAVIMVKGGWVGGGGAER